jgi:hypothetical protein
MTRVARRVRQAFNAFASSSRSLRLPLSTSPSAPSGGDEGTEAVRVTTVTAATTLDGMSQPPDRPSPQKPKLTPQERRVREDERLRSIRLRVLIGRELDDRGITDPAAIGAALGMPAAEATKLLTRSQRREGDVALLEAAVARLGVKDRRRMPPGGLH